jgi:hypothetical protein
MPTWDNSHGWFLLTVAGLLALAPPGRGTAVVGVRGFDGFILAADSKVVYGPGDFGPPTTCKIFSSGPLYFALAGFAFDGRRDFYPNRIVARVFSPADPLQRNLDKISAALSDALNIEMGRLKVEDRPAYERNLGNHDKDTLSIVAGEFVGGIAYMGSRGLRYLDGGVLPAEGDDCPGNCEMGSKIFLAGHNVESKKVAYAIGRDGKTHNLTVDVRLMIQSEIDATPSEVGLPITILEVSRDGPKWISNEMGCPATAVP